MEGWDGFIENLTHVSRLIHKAHSRERFSETCATEDVREFFVQHVDLAKLVVYPGRWGTICAAVKQLGIAVWI